MPTYTHRGTTPEAVTHVLILPRPSLEPPIPNRALPITHRGGWLHLPGHEIPRSGIDVDPLLTVARRGGRT